MNLTKEQKEYAKKNGYSEEQMKRLLARINSEGGVVVKRGSGPTLGEMKKNKRK